MNKILPFSMRALGSAFLSFALLSLNLGPSIAQAVAIPSGYNIHITSATPTGLKVNINGTASANPYVGNQNQQFVYVTN